METLAVIDEPGKALPTIQVSECFGPTIQGEGLDIGKPCLFIRLHHCPVKCPGCDTHYTWDGSEPGKAWTLDSIFGWCVDKLNRNVGCGIVLSGGEPLIHFRNGAFHEMLRALGTISRWISLETSGFVGPRQIEDERHFRRFLRLFTTVHFSPKITPCLRGPWTDEQMSANLPLILAAFVDVPWKLAFKFVVRDQLDVDAVLAYVDRHELRKKGHHLMLMPYGINAEDVAASCRALVPVLAEHGFTLSPRLHSLLWGKQRGV